MMPTIVCANCNDELSVESYGDHNVNVYPCDCVDNSLRAVNAALLEACQGLVNNLPDCAINWARDCIGNTNAAVIIHWRDKTKAAIRLATEETK